MAAGIGCSASLVGGGSDKMLLQTSYNRYKMLGWMHVFFSTKSSAAFSPQLAFSNAPVMQRMQCPYDALPYHGREVSKCWYLFH